MVQRIGTAGRSFWRRPWFKRGCCADDDDDDDDDGDGDGDDDMQVINETIIFPHQFTNYDVKEMLMNINVASLSYLVLKR